MRKRPDPEFYFTIDILISVLVLAVVIAVLVSSVSRMRRIVEISAASAEVLTTHRTPVSVLFALRGEWPSDLDDVRRAFPVSDDWTMSTRLKDLLIEDGAMTVSLKFPLSGERLTVHPAVLSGDPTGPVRWVAGPGGRRNGWATVGADHTTVQDSLIPVLLER